MTGKIESTLFSSEAARSLLMEKHVADTIRTRHWKVKTGIYYTDKDTNKLREMDVFGIQVFDKPRKSKRVGAPLINLYLNCECKSLAGSNVLFLPDKVADPFEVWGTMFWLGHEAKTIVLDIAEQARITDHGRIKRLYDYVTDRAYADGDRAINKGVSMIPPPVDIHAWSFRETRGGKSKDEYVVDRSQSTPVWNAVRPALGAAQAAQRKAKATSLEWVYGLDLKFYGANSFADSAAFFLDAELFRTEFFHSVVVLDARLWRTDSDKISEVKSARLFVSNVDHANDYVDLVNSKFIDQYVDTMINHYEKSARRSISKQWKLIKEIGWEPGQARKSLLAILHSKNLKKR